MQYEEVFQYDSMFSLKLPLRASFLCPLLVHQSKYGEGFCVLFFCILARIPSLPCFHVWMFFALPVLWIPKLGSSVSSVLFWNWSSFPAVP